ncbi:hypothetical protein BGZ96_008366 [Linnemannia gamsii]|uniref:F-box domain-containing protein n=1 Tax=Linnemannia gamsii TaxID=64522 RepID=A0ABQ7JYW9_9FUNG|nr:hypothetical protein BGZ96_008366 [Linnemannia gamsii]
MDHLSRLPLECLQHIFKILAHNNESVSFRAFSALVRVNRSIATNVLPYLYHYPHTGIHYSQVIKKGDGTRSLLACLSFTSLPPTLAHYLARDPLLTQAPKPTFDYLSCVRYLHPPAFEKEPLIFLPDKEHTVEEKAYLQGEEYARLRRSICVLPAYVNSYSSEDEFFLHLHNIIVYRETVWSLASPILDQLESLTIPLSDIDRYLEVIGRLSRLERIDIIIDEVYEFRNLLVDEPTRQCKEEAMRSLLQFVENHGRLFVGRLRTVNICDSPIWSGPYRTHFEDIQLQIYRLLPPMPPPRILDHSNWTRLMCHPLTTNLSYVERITALQQQISAPLSDYPRLFQRCRALKSLKISALGKGNFKWAVQEKESAGGGSEDLVPLESLNMRNCDSLTEEVNDIAFAFSNTLQRISVDEGVRGSTTRLGQGWVDMPKLTHLNITVRINRLLLDSLLLAHCPNLIVVNLTDKTQAYQCWDIVSMAPAQLGQLSTLSLQGWPALTFNPTTLHSTSKLGFLSIRSNHIPPFEEQEQSFTAQNDILLEETEAEAGSGTEGSQNEGVIQARVGHRPPWTWDWVLPQLRVLELSGEFAYRFEFRMLRGCPSLEALTLMIYSEQDTHTRVLSEDDFFVIIPATTHPDTTIGRQRVRRPKIKGISAPALRGLTMRGPWVLDDSLVPMFFHGMFPKLSDVVMLNSMGFGLPALVDCLRGKAKHIMQVDVNFPEPSLEEQRELGLYPRMGRKKNNSDTYQVTILFNDVDYLLLRDVATSLAAPFVSPAPSSDVLL